MSLTTETAVTAIAQVQAAYNCADLDAITRMQGAAAKAGDESSLEVLCAIKGVLIAQAGTPSKPGAQTMNAFRNLYKIKNVGGLMIAHITAADETAAIHAYHAAAGNGDEVFAERMTNGYPEDVCALYE